VSPILVSGLINLEITLKVDGFPIDYAPVRYPFGGVNSSVSGVGYNLAKALTTLGNDVDLLSLIGKDPARTLVYEALAGSHIPSTHVLDSMEATAHSVILYDGEGRRQINVDLKAAQETPYPEDIARQALESCDLAALCNINCPVQHQLLAPAVDAGSRCRKADSDRCPHHQRPRRRLQPRLHGGGPHCSRAMSACR